MVTSSRRRRRGAFSTGCPRPRSHRTVKRRWGRRWETRRRIRREDRRVGPARKGVCPPPWNGTSPRSIRGRVAFPTPSPTAPRFLRGTGAVDEAWKTRHRCTLCPCRARPAVTVPGDEHRPFHLGHSPIRDRIPDLCDAVEYTGSDSRSGRRRRRWCREAFSTGCPRPRSPRTVKRRWAGGGKRGVGSARRPLCRPAHKGVSSSLERNIAPFNPGPSRVSHTFAHRASVSPGDRRRGRSVENAPPLYPLSLPGAPRGNGFPATQHRPFQSVREGIRLVDERCTCGHFRQHTRATIADRRAPARRRAPRYALPHTWPLCPYTRIRPKRSTRCASPAAWRRACSR